MNLRTGAVADSQERISGWIAVGRRAFFAAGNARIERFNPTVAEVMKQTFDQR